MNVEFYVRIIDGKKIKDEAFVYNLIKLVKFVKEKDDSVSCQGSVNSLIVEDMNVWTYLYNYQNELTKLLLDLFTKSKCCDSNDAMLSVELNDSSKNNGLIGEKTNLQLNDEIVHVLDEKSTYRLKAHYLIINNNGITREILSKCFDNLFFCFKNKMNLYEQQDVRQAMDAIVFLNNEGSNFYSKHNKDTKEAVRMIQAETNIICTADSNPKKIDCIIDGHRVKVTFNPHFKFEHGGTNKRLYFAWGNKYTNNKIVVHSIGEHL